MRAIGHRGIFGALVACAFASLVWAGPAQADAGACSLNGSGREGATDTTVFQVPDQTLEAAMIFVDFSNHVAAGGETPPNTTVAPALVDRATDYLDDVSYGQTDLAVEYDTAWRRMDLPSTSYSVATFDGQRAFMQAAIQKADAAGFNFAGKQTVIVVAAPEALSGTAAFHGTAAQGITVDGTNVRWGTTVGDDAARPAPGTLAQWPQYGSKVLSHELMHTFGLPDLYRAGAPTFETQHLDAGSWDIMGWPGPGMHILGWHRQKLGWLGPPNLVCVNGTSTATLTPMETAGGTKMLVSKTAPGIAYVAEVRARLGLDSEMCDSGGVLIYKVNADGGNAFGNGIAPISVKPVYPDEPGNPSGPCAALSNAAFELGPGEPSTFTEGPVSVEILSGSPGAGYTVRMTGPDPNPAPATTPPATKKCKKGRKLKKGKCVKKKRKRRK